MTKVPQTQVEKELSQADYWSDMDEWQIYEDTFWEKYEEDTLSWQWYMSIGLVRDEGWKYVVINPAYKNTTVEFWLKQHYPDSKYKFERNHFLIQDAEAASMVALKWS